MVDLSGRRREESVNESKQEERGVEGGRWAASFPRLSSLLFT